MTKLNNKESNNAINKWAKMNRQSSKAEQKINTWFFNWNCHQRNANQNYIEISAHFCQNENHQENSISVSGMFSNDHKVSVVNRLLWQHSGQLPEGGLISWRVLHPKLLCLRDGMWCLQILIDLNAWLIEILFIDKKKYCMFLMNT